MANPILPKHNNTAGKVPSADSLMTNELAINTADAVAYVKHTDGTVKQIVDPTKATLASPAFTGTPTAPTAATGTSTTQIATTEFVNNVNNSKAPLDSPSFTGTPKAPTADAGTSTTQLATTEFVTKADNLKANVASPSFTGQVFIPEGTVSAPGLTFQNDDSADTGLYHISNGNIGVTCNGTEVVAFTPSGANLLGVPTAPTAASGTNNTQVATTEYVTTAINNLDLDFKLYFLMGQ
jgi:hypothetical protein